MSAVPVSAALPTHGADAVSAQRASRRPSRVERRLARRLRHRTAEAVTELYAEYGGATFGFLVRALPDRAAAEDVQQTVFTEVWHRAHEYDPRRASPLTWILTIARSRAIDHLRRRTPEPRDPDSLADETAPGEDPTQRLLGDARVSWLLGRLPVEEAEVLRLRFRDDRTQAEIADRLGLPLGTVKMRMVQGLGRLREAIETEEA